MEPAFRQSCNIEGNHATDDGHVRQLLFQKLGIANTVLKTDNQGRGLCMAQYLSCSFWGVCTFHRDQN